MLNHVVSILNTSLIYVFWGLVIILLGISIDGFKYYVWYTSVYNDPLHADTHTRKKERYNHIWLMVALLTVLSAAGYMMTDKRNTGPSEKQVIEMKLKYTNQELDEISEELEEDSTEQSARNKLQNQWNKLENRKVDLLNKLDNIKIQEAKQYNREHETTTEPI